MKKRNAINNIIEYLKDITVGNNDFKYAVIYSIFGLLIILIKQVFTFITQSSDQIANPNYYYFIAVLGFGLLIGLLVIQFKKLGPKNKFASIFIMVYPYLFTLLGMSIIGLYSSYNAKVVSFIVFMIILFWIQIYRLAKRIIVFAFSAASYVALSYYTYGSTENFYQDITLASMVALITLLASTILYQLHKSHQKVITDLDNRNRNYGIIIENLKQTHTSLKVSKSITDSMYELTQEVLRNENLEDVLQLVLDKAAALIPHTQAGSILLLNGEKMEFVAANGYDIQKLKKIKLKPEETFQAKLTDKYEPFIVKNLVSFDESLMGKERTSKLLKATDIVAKSCMTCSFKYGDKFFGSINVDNFDSEDAFFEEHKYLMKQLAKEIEIIISIHKLYEQALRPTKYDELTQAKTRRYCMRLLNELIETKKDSNISICTIDINNLKEVNDEFGHDVGDKLLFEFAEAVRKSKIRENIFGRVGGDEFLLIFKESSKDETLSQVEIIRKYLKKKAFLVNDKKIEITFASGVVVYGVDGENVSELIKLSDKRMYEDKSIQKKIKKV